MTFGAVMREDELSIKGRGPAFGGAGAGDDKPAIEASEALVRCARLPFGDVPSELLGG